MPWQEGLEPKAQTRSFKGSCDLFKSDTKTSSSIILQRSCCGRWKPCIWLCSYTPKHSGIQPCEPFVEWGSGLCGCSALLLLPVVWIFSSTCRIYCIFMWKEHSTENVVHLFHSLEQKTRILIFIYIYIFFLLYIWIRSTSASYSPQHTRHKIYRWLQSMQHLLWRPNLILLT